MDHTFAWDADASNFLARAGVADPVVSNAVNQLVVDLKTTGLWEKCDAIYPFVGGTAASHAQNLKSSGYTISWSGGTSQRVYVNAAASSGDAWAATGTPNCSLYLLASYDTQFGIANFSNACLGGASAGAGFSGNDVAAWRAAWDAFEMALGRSPASPAVSR